ncbi:chitinase [Microbacterium album]|nr:carbohydrate-binding protein [Microbacterium album]
MSKRFPGRRLSIFRLTVLVAIVAALVVGGLTGFRWWQDEREAERSTPWFASYVDVTATPAHPFESVADDEPRHAVLSFVVAAGEGACEASWGTHYSLDEARQGLDLERRIARLRQAGGDVIVSFGGLLNDELALACDSVDALADEYRRVIDRYELATIDLDIEGAALADERSRTRRAEAIAQIQQEQRDAGESPVSVWLTLPVGSSGMPPDAVATVQSFLDAGANIAGVNVMTMNFTGAEAATGLAEVIEGSLRATHRQLVALYTDHGLSVGDRTAWRMVGATPMIGQNDVVAETFTLDDARALNAFAADVGLGRMSMWSANRDRTCAAAYVDLHVVSDSCSGVDQGDLRFATVLAAGFRGSPDHAAADAATPPPPVRPGEITDDPATSPYPIWDEEATYPAETRVVWRRNVYAAKWWTSGDQPDDPTVAATDHPWRLIGPVLPGETPVPQLSLPADFYPAWTRGDVYVAGDRVMLDGIAYEARWWTQGDNPAAVQLDPGGAPWVPLTQDEIAELLSEE